MNQKELTDLHKGLDKLPTYGKDKEEYTLIHYADVAVMIDQIYKKYSQKEDNKRD